MHELIQIASIATATLQLPPETDPDPCKRGTIESRPGSPRGLPAVWSPAPAILAEMPSRASVQLPPPA